MKNQKVNFQNAGTLIKKMFSAVFAFVIISVNCMFVNAESNYDPEVILATISEEDGTITGGCTVYNEQGQIFGLSPDEGRYLENLLPVEQYLSDFNEISDDIDLSSPLHYSPSDNGFVFSWRNKGKSNVDSISINIINADTGEIVARGYNIEAETKYVSYFDLKEVNLDIELLTVLGKTEKVKMFMGSLSNGKAAKLEDYVLEKKDISYEPEVSNIMALTTADIITTAYNTATVPQNIDGNQGEFLIYHTVQGSSGHRVQHAKFWTGTNGMMTINIRQYWLTYAGPYTMNLARGSTVNFGISTAVGDPTKFKMSTNSTPGAAAVDIMDTIY